jgi:hypothetical protein
MLSASPQSIAAAARENDAGFPKDPDWRVPRRRWDWPDFQKRGAATIPRSGYPFPAGPHDPGWNSASNQREGKGGKIW